MKIWNQKNKLLIITQIINMIKKYHISIEEIIEEYINSYQTKFPTEHQILYIKQYNNFLTIKKQLENNIYMTEDDYIIINKTL